MTPQDMKAARVALNWTQAQLAEKAGDAKPLHPKTVAYWERQAALPDRLPHALRAIQDTLKAATGCATDNPRAALNEAFDLLTPAARVQAALLVIGLGHRT
jgi:transcriptional regulator with XRE-family HTH domain